VSVGKNDHDKMSGKIGLIYVGFQYQKRHFIRGDFMG